MRFAVTNSFRSLTTETNRPMHSVFHFVLPQNCLIKDSNHEYSQNDTTLDMMSTTENRNDSIQGLITFVLTFVNKKDNYGLSFDGSLTVFNNDIS